MNTAIGVRIVLKKEIRFKAGYFFVFCHVNRKLTG